MARHLAEVQAKTRLSLGKSIAQFLSCQQEAEYTILKWLTIAKGGDYKAYSIYYSEVFGDESEPELDIVELTPVEPDDSPSITEFDTIEEALTFAAATYGASPQRYVTEGMLNEEYVAYLNEHDGVGG